MAGVSHENVHGDGGGDVFLVAARMDVLKVHVDDDVHQAPGALDGAAPDHVGRLRLKAKALLGPIGAGDGLPRAPRVALPEEVGKDRLLTPPEAALDGQAFSHPP